MAHPSSHFPRSDDDNPSRSSPPTDPSDEVPGWIRPKVRVRQRGDVICAEQMVPARVVEIRSGTEGSRFARTRTKRLYESGLGTTQRSTRLVRERLTVAASTVGGLRGVRNAVDAALASAKLPGRRAARSLEPFVNLGLAGLSLAFLGMAVWMFGLISREFNDSGDFASMFQGAIAFLGAGAVFMFGLFVHRAWLLRTPNETAEAQWELLRATLLRIGGREPGSSRPIDEETGHARDLIAHPRRDLPFPGMGTAGPNRRGRPANPQ